MVRRFHGVSQTIDHSLRRQDFEYKESSVVVSGHLVTRSVLRIPIRHTLC